MAGPLRKVGVVQFFKQPSSPILYKLVGTGATFRGVPASLTEWVAAGQPKPITLTRPEYRKFPWSNAVFESQLWGPGAPTSGLVHLSPAQWRAVGYPRVVEVNWLPTARIVKWGTSDELILKAADTSHRLTFAEWAKTYYQPFANNNNQGFVKTRTSNTVYRVSDLARNKGVPISFATWAAEGYPTPRVVATAPTP
ncbi:hypothetical protein JT358_13335 [Micrococcales bacterium 31B]|nr:hypothetical protein [Micrococcales bacterium 31B]